MRRTLSRPAGGVLPAALFLTLACALLGLLFSNVAAVGLDADRATTAADFALLSAMRVRRDGLETIAGRWLAFGGNIMAGPTGLVVAPPAWPSVSAAADALRRSLSGFQGRITSALTVSLDANDFPRSAARTLTGTGLRLGVTAKTESVLVSGVPTALPGAWYARGWAPADAAPRLTDGAVLDLEWPVVWLGGAATVAARSSALLEWDADPSDPPVAALGKGGFARTVAEAVDGAAFTPHRFPVFRAAPAEAP